MQTSNFGERKLTELDFTRLTRFTTRGAMAQLADLLDEARIVRPQAIPADVVTMYARFIIRDLKLRRRQVLMLCYPWDADPAKGHVSVLSPAGMGLIGLPAGALARWAGPGGQQSVVRIEEILFQPEATGNYVT
ncbi:MAG: GreA/GreB family elongation factor [Microvirga sp.]